jgi:hypothetical protein
MAEQPLSATVIGLDQLNVNLSDLTGPPLAQLLTDASNHAKSVAAKGVSGTAARSIMTEVKPGSARVFSLMSEARSTSIELGRPAGGPLVHPDALRRWVSAVGYAGTPAVLARQIKRRGVKGRFFMRAAIQSTQNALPVMLRRMAGDVVSRFGRR